MSNFNTMYPEGKKITIAGIEFAIKPFVLRVRTQVLRILAEVIMEYTRANPGANLQDFSQQGDMVVKMITVAGDRLVDIYEIVLGKDKEWLRNNVTLGDEINVLQAIVEVNDLPFLFEQVKSLLKGIKKTS